MVKRGAAQIARPNGGGTFYSVSGNVKADGANLPNARVVLMIDGSVVESAATDADGNYSLNALEGTTYAASVYKDGFNFNPTFQILPNVQTNQTVNFQNGVRLCVSAPLGQTGGNFCQTAAETTTSTIENGKIVFERFNATYSMNANGSEQMLIPPGGGYPQWSPDGTKILYHRSPTSLPSGL